VPIVATFTIILPVVPPESGNAVPPPTAVPSTKNCTVPNGFPPVTVALTVRVPLAATFVEDTVRRVTVAVCALPLLLEPPQPRVKLKTQTSPNPKAAR
jgi:hypothetical protein